MNWAKKFWIGVASLAPLSAGAAVPVALVGLIGGAVSIAGFSIYRSAVPVNMSDALSFFTTCWSCQLFSDIMTAMSNLLPPVYSGLGRVIIPISAILMALWFAWQLVSGFMNSKIPAASDIATKFGMSILKFGTVIALLVLPLPRLINDAFITPVFNIGLSVNHMITDKDAYASCIVATAIAEPASANDGAFSPQLRHSLACEVANVHQITGLGMTVGWTMMNSAFESDNMHKILWGVPIFPNIPYFFTGLMILTLFLFALFPIPLYFLEIFITLALDLVMLPFMLMAWLFPQWNIMPKGGKNIRQIIDEVIQGTAGIAMTGVFLTVSVMFLDAVFGKWNGVSRLASAIAQNDSSLLMDGLALRNDSIITIILIGLFVAMFMNSIPNLVTMLFSNVKISNKYYESVKKNLGIFWENAKKIAATIKK